MGLVGAQDGQSGDFEMGLVELSRIEAVAPASAGGNSNWRGPVWMPVNYLLLESLQKFHHDSSDDFRVECPTGSGKKMTLWEVPSAGTSSWRATWRGEDALPGFSCKVAEFFEA